MPRDDELIHDGGNSLIYLQFSPKFARPVIRKVLKADFPSPSQLIQLKNEYEVTRELEIPGVRPALEFTQVGGRRQLILEYVAGMNIGEYFSQNKTSLRTFLDRKSVV